MKIAPHKIRTCFLALVMMTTLGLAQQESLAGERTVFFKYQDAAIVEQGKEVYKQNCASCHGTDLEGDPQWQVRRENGKLRAPPHDVSGHTWHHPEQTLFFLVKHGIVKLLNNKPYPNDMPIFGEKISDDEILAVLSHIKSTWPEHLQKTHDQLSAHTH
jgi:S-disulfanyl-L-cysteine oxidoreductase SoxD